jgi:nitrite reductase/ring-hydroxylating ferredoxin subunit
MPDGMYLSAGSSKRSLRDAPGGDENHLIVGGAGHVVGRASSTEQRLDELRSWTSRWFPDAKETHAWSAQDYSPYGGVPLVGRLSPTNGRVLVATGFDKWGMTNAVAAALAISSELLGSRAPTVRTLPFHPAPFLQLARMQAGVGAALAKGFARSEHAGVVPVAERTVDGRLCRMVGVCTHLGGPLTWNDAEESWDCALHGSRFTPDGSVLEGPATKPLRPY